MPCLKCGGFMLKSINYDDGIRCLNCGNVIYLPMKLRIIDEKEYKYGERSCGNGNRTVRKANCLECGKEFIGKSYKYCGATCQNAVTNRNAKNLRNHKRVANV